MLTKESVYDIISSCSGSNTESYQIVHRSVTFDGNGGIAQLARAIGSYPIGRGFKSNFRYQHKADADNNGFCLMIRPVGQAVKTPPFHGGNSSSILLRVTKTKRERNAFSFFVLPICPQMSTRQLARRDNCICSQTAERPAVLLFARPPIAAPKAELLVRSIICARREW